MEDESNLKRGQLRGYLFEVIIRLLLKKSKWNLVSKKENGRVRIHNDNEYKIEIKGRGTWHQIDNPCIFSGRIPFIFPLRLLGEAKFYKNGVSKDKIRAFITVIKDISENYFIDNNAQNLPIRYTDIGVFFSAKGFQEEATNLAFVHGIQTISYKTNFEMNLIVDKIEQLEIKCLSCKNTISSGRLVKFMEDIEKVIDNYEHYINYFIQHYDDNRNSIYENRGYLKELSDVVKSLQTSFFGITSTGILLNFLSKEPFPEELFREVDEQLCKIFYNEGLNMWLEFSEDEEKRRFYFDIPYGLEEIILKGGNVLDEKERHFEQLTVSYFINNILRSLILKIDKEWLERIKRARKDNK